MGHEWGFNVANQGFAYVGKEAGSVVFSNVTLAARLLPLSSSNLWVLNAESGNFFKIVQIPSDTNLPFLWFTPNKVSGHPHFPYGRTVEPDAPT